MMIGFIVRESFGNHGPSARWTFFDPAPPRFAQRKMGTAPYFQRKIGRCPSFSVKALRCGGRGPRKIFNACFRDMISKLRKGL